MTATNNISTYQPIVHIIEGNILYIKDDCKSEEEYLIHWQKIDELVKTDEVEFVLVDLTEAIRPDAKTRAMLKKRLLEISPYFKHISFYTGKNTLLNIAAFFILKAIMLKSHSVTKTRDTAMKKIKTFQHGN